MNAKKQIAYDPKSGGSVFSWLEQTMLFWFERITDYNGGGFFEELDANSCPIQTPDRTLYVQARLLNVASYGCKIFPNTPEFQRVANHGWKWLQLCHKDMAQDWCHLYTDTGQVIDNRRDLYDHAALLAALGRYYSATANYQTITYAHQIQDFLTKYLADTENGGYAEEWIGKLPRRHNPHMHLLEAYLILHSATHEKMWLRETENMATLFFRHFRDNGTGAVVEFFGEKWEPDFKFNGPSSSPDGQPALRQPGHHFEWARLLKQASQLLGWCELNRLADGLTDFALVNGVDKYGPLPGTSFDGLDANGVLTHPTRSFWQSLERLALLSEADATQKVAIQTLLGSITNGFIRADGLTWHNRLDSDLRSTDKGRSFARLLVHLVPAMHKACQTLS